MQNLSKAVDSSPLGSRLELLRVWKKIRLRICAFKQGTCTLAELRKDSCQGLKRGTGAQKKVSPKNWNCPARAKGSSELGLWRSSSNVGDLLCARNRAGDLRLSSWGTETPGQEGP